ncbi:MAG TPA: hypothetical protein VL335_03685 [Candidatus Paceibacterota bacterium]|nr:hypothetical protein [Candidatus Paceibacterota bacterium]
MLGSIYENGVGNEQLWSFISPFERADGRGGVLNDVLDLSPKHLPPSVTTI